ncbi:hypothetical protein BDN72DRAFT_824041 [Pluteus cervinus]|uniref:Uncharacterized protein n=1 Tax=Pluteus cervinus TaxID=181527 RepID=A0ACD3AK99_9AGAR|nr:hypothetical protein BDN72DRAFT_824041 [Pluteus cervinus]
MASLLATMTIPATTPSASTQTLLWTDDGQVCFITKAAVYILTPDHGMNYDLTALVKPKFMCEPPVVLGWFKTIIKMEDLAITKWPEYSLSWGVLSLGSLDLSMWEVAPSPANMYPDSGSILAIRDTNTDLSLWAPDRNFLKGQWKQVVDITSILLQGVEDDVPSILHAQVTGIGWTPQADFGLTPIPVADGSLLITGNRAGRLVFFRYQPHLSTVLRLHIVGVSTTWVTRIATRPWKATSLSDCETVVAYATADGAVGMLKVTQSIEVVPSSHVLVPQYNIEASFDSQPIELHSADKSSATALKWISTKRNQHILAHCKPGRILLWTDDPSLPWTGSRVFRFSLQKLSVMSSPFHPATGVNYIAREDILVIALADSSVHVLHNLSVDPSWDPAPVSDGLITTKNLSEGVRNLFLNTEGGAVDFTDAQCARSFTSYDGGRTFFWASAPERPADFSYKHDARHITTLFTGELWDKFTTQHFLEDISDVLASRSVLFVSPLLLLRPFFIQMRNRARFAAFKDELMKSLQVELEDHSTKISIPAYSGELTQELRKEFRISLYQHLFGYELMIATRMRLSLADYAWARLMRDEAEQLKVGETAQKLLNAVAHRNLRTIIRHLVAVSGCLTVEDVPFVLRVNIQSFLPGTPQDLGLEAQNLDGILNRTGLGMVKIFHETCPACRVEIPLQNVTTAVCSNGHSWSRCAITSFILATTHVRTCVGCSRKAFLPISATGGKKDWLPKVAQGWVVEELLEAVHRCLFCSNRFVTLL